MLINARFKKPELAHGINLLPHLSGGALYHDTMPLIQRAGNDATYLVSEYNLDLEERVRCALPIAIDGSGELLQGPFHIQSQGFLNHPIHMFCVCRPVAVNITTITTEYLCVCVCV